MMADHLLVYPPELIPQKTALGCRCPGTFRQGASQERVAFGGPAALPLSRASIITRTDSTTGAQVTGTGKSRHIPTRFGEDCRRTSFLYARNGL